MAKTKKNQHLFWLIDMNPKATEYISFMDVIGMGTHAERIIQKDNKRDKKIRVRLTGLSKIADGTQNIILCQPGNVITNI